jgi:hypothetical protein
MQDRAHRIRQRAVDRDDERLALRTSGAMPTRRAKSESLASAAGAPLFERRRPLREARPLGPPPIACTSAAALANVAVLLRRFLRSTRDLNIGNSR